MKYFCLAVAGACLAFSTPASAKQCPTGQIFRVSKGVCMDKAEAVKSGIIGATSTQKVRVARLSDKPASAESGAETVVEKSTPRQSAQKSARNAQPLGYAATSQDEPAFVTSSPPEPRQEPKPTVSPYGGLRLDYFGAR